MLLTKKQQTFIVGFFLLTGASTLVAALVGHAFLYHFGIEAKIYGWVTGIFGTCLAQFGALYHTRKTIGERIFKTLLVICILEVITSVLLTFVVWSFVVVEVHSAFVLVLMVTVLESIHYKKTKSALSLNMIYGVGIAVIAVLCHVLKLAYSVWFNHADLSHIFMALSMYMMYRGVAQYKPAKELER